MLASVYVCDHVHRQASGKQGGEAGTLRNRFPRVTRGLVLLVYRSPQVIHKTRDLVRAASKAGAVADTPCPWTPTRPASPTRRPNTQTTNQHREQSPSNLPSATRPAPSATGAAPPGPSSGRRAEGAAPAAEVLLGWHRWVGEGAGEGTRRRGER